MSKLNEYIFNDSLIALDLLKSDLGFGVVESIKESKKDSSKDELLIRFHYENDFKGYKNFYKTRMRKEVKLFEIKKDSE